MDCGSQPRFTVRGELCNARLLWTSAAAALVSPHLQENTIVSPREVGMLMNAIAWNEDVGLKRIDPESDYVRKQGIRSNVNKYLTKCIRITRLHRRTKSTMCVTVHENRTAASYNTFV